MSAGTITEPVLLRDFAERLEDIMRSADRDWVNFAATSVDHGTLLLAVEYFRAEKSSTARRPASVNYSGISGAVLQQDS